MNRPILSALAVGALALASAASAQPESDGGPYGGHRPGAFYDIDRREAAIEARLHDATRRGRLRGGDARRALDKLRAIRGEEAFRRDRHGGELRDWDRELLTRRLDQLDAGLPR